MRTMLQAGDRDKGEGEGGPRELSKIFRIYKLEME